MYSLKHDQRLPCLLMATALLLAPTAYAQQDEPPATDGQAESDTAPASGQVEANEDIYRQFMELKDGLQRRDIQPQESWQSRSGLQKIDDLPEDSQKHLRNQLRGIIVEGGAWQPGDQDKDYPYVPSESAADNPRLQRQEAEAWGELLDNYHAREAQIYANAARSRAASATAGMHGESGMQITAGQRADAPAGQQAQQETATASAADSFAPSTQSGAGAPNEQGVAQSAMEFLQRAGYQQGNGQQAQSGTEGQAMAQGQQPDQQGQPGSQGQQAQMGQQGEQDQAGQAGQLAQQEQPAQQAQQSTSAAASAEAQSSTDAASMSMSSQAAEGEQQNAMQYLQQAASSEADETQQADETDSQGDQASATSRQDTHVVIDLTDSGQATENSDDEPATEGVSQSALEYLSGQEPSDTQADTLSIEDLLNAGGLGAQPAEKEKPDKPDKDG